MKVWKVYFTLTALAYSSIPFSWYRNKLESIKKTLFFVCVCGGGIFNLLDFVGKISFCPKWSEWAPNDLEWSNNISFYPFGPFWQFVVQKGLLTNIQGQNYDHTVNIFLSINNSNTNNIKKFWVGIFKSQSHINQNQVSAT